MLVYRLPSYFQWHFVFCHLQSHVTCLKGEAGISQRGSDNRHPVHTFFKHPSHRDGGLGTLPPPPSLQSPPPMGGGVILTSFDKRLLCCSLCAGAHYHSRLFFLFIHKCMPQAIMSGTTLAAGVPLLATVIGPSPSGPEFLDIQYRGTVDVVQPSYVVWRQLHPVSLGCLDHSPQPAITATPQAPPPTRQAPIPKLVPKCGVKRTSKRPWTSF